MMDLKKNEYWNQVVDDFLLSGLTQVEYARQKGLKLYSLGYWVRKRQSTFKGFVEVKDTPITLDQTSKIEITFNKMKIAVTGSYDEELLLRVLRTVKNV
jgi:arginyl-tRNA--protein-N-Asp/Glu arginylyltransferase